MSENISSENTPGGSGSDISEDFNLKVHGGNVNTSNLQVAVIGTGNFGRALGERIQNTGSASVMYGSRRFSEDNGFVSIEDAVSAADIIILAVPHFSHEDVVKQMHPFLHEKRNAAKIIVDVSNRPPRKLWQMDKPIRTSYTEQLTQALRNQGLFQPVVKCFNTVSAYALNEDGIRSPQTVHMCGDDQLAKQEVASLVRSMGLTPLDVGKEKAARYQESLPHSFFKGWKTAILVGTIVFVFWSIYSLIRNYIIKLPPRGPGLDAAPTLAAYRIPIGVTIAATGETSMTLFSIVFLASTVAAAVQLKRRTASRPFNKVLSSWLAVRKPLGLIAFFVVLIHGIGGCIKPSHLENEGRETALGPLYLLFGIISFCLFLVLAASSNTSVSSTLSWVEFKFIFSWLGFGGLAFGLAHMVTFGAMIQQLHPSSPSKWPGKLMSPYWLGAVIPSLALLGKLIISTPCIGRPLTKIRGLV